ncbi:MAG: glycerophosphodiester phosphodiesterase family protein [Bacteroidota bacterium]
MNRRAGQRPLVVGHRGSAGTAPENTMAAFRIAADAGADMVEFDVRMTADGHFVVHHDRSLGRTSDGRGRIHELTLTEVQSVDAGGWFAQRFRGERIPTLRQVLEELPPRMGVNIEVKTDGHRRRSRAAADALLATLRAARRTDGIVVSSFDQGFLRRFRRRSPDVPIGALYLPIRDGLRPASSVARRVGGSVFICSRAQLRRRHVRDAHAHGVAVAVYGVNTIAELRHMIEAGVDAVITDFPERIVRALRSA